MLHSVRFTIASLLGRFVKLPEHEDRITQTKRTFFIVGQEAHYHCHLHLQACHVVLFFIVFETLTINVYSILLEQELEI